MANIRKNSTTTSETLAMAASDMVTDLQAVVEQAPARAVVGALQQQSRMGHAQCFCCRHVPC